MSDAEAPIKPFPNDAPRRQAPARWVTVGLAVTFVISVIAFALGIWAGKQSNDYKALQTAVADVRSDVEQIDALYAEVSSLRSKLTAHEQLLAHAAIISSKSDLNLAGRTASGSLFTGAGYWNALPEMKYQRSDHAVGSGGTSAGPSVGGASAVGLLGK